MLTLGSSRFIACAFGLFVFLVGIVLDVVLIDVGTSRSVMLIFTNALTGTAGGIALWIMVRNEVRRRVEESHRLVVLDEMNHHVRNALQVVVFYCYSMEGESATTLRRAVDRIQWSLTEILPRITFEDGSKKTAIQ